MAEYDCSHGERSVLTLKRGSDSWDAMSINPETQLPRVHIRDLDYDEMAWSCILAVAEKVRPKRIILVWENAESTPMSVGDIKKLMNKSVHVSKPTDHDALPKVRYQHDTI